MMRGIALLDEHGPADWRERINPYTLDIQSGHNCVLGQLYGVYSRGADALGFDIEDGGDYGFATRFNYRMLNKRWKEELARSA